MTALLHAARWPVPEHLRPKPRRPVVTEMLRRPPRLADELNAIVADVWSGEGSPGRGWNGWSHTEIPPAEALALPCGGEA